jgi:hypothetical protein
MDGMVLSALESFEKSRKENMGVMVLGAELFSSIERRATRLHQTIPISENDMGHPFHD